MSTPAETSGDEHRLGTTGQVLVCAEYDQAVRWHDGERLNHLFEQRCDWLRAQGHADHAAIDTGDTVLSYERLEALANQLARYLLARGARPGDRIGLLFDQPVRCHVGMLAVLKINAAYVPLDVGFPADRLAYIARDAQVRMVLSLSRLSDHLHQVATTVLYVDQAESRIAAQDTDRLTDAEAGEPVDELCYVIYTSGTTGRPKGVAIQQASICNFVRVAVEVYGIRPDDRVYQGMTIAFDFSVEEIWVPLMSGATLVPKPGGVSLLGHELWEFLNANRVTALCCVPTLLATLDEDLPALRFLLVSGEPCSRDLVVRWHTPARRFLNVYGPTEATVTATWTSVDPDRPVTIGVPLPTYAVIMLDPEADRALPRGEIGEIGIAGVGLAAGYLNRADLTDRVFIPDFLGIEGNRSERIYRTGDLGRINDNGEIEYHGRIDTQVKIRGYRIELTEIESVLSGVPGIALAVIDTCETAPGAPELVGYYSTRGETSEVDPHEIYARLRERLPAYMVPAYLERLTTIPMLPSGKVDRKNLPKPQGPRGQPTRNYLGPTTDTEAVLTELLTGIMNAERISVDSHFFDDLGANSLLMARFCAVARKRAGVASISMKDVYLHPTIERLAAALPDVAASTTPTPAAEAGPAVAGAGRASYLLCGALLLVMFLGYAYLIAMADIIGYEWVGAGGGWATDYLRALALGCALFVGLCVVPVLAKWLLIGRWKPRRIPLWSLSYVRFWTVRTLLRFSPLVLFVGSPLYVLYLKALGARIGRGVVILTRHMPVCTDLLTIGAGTVIRKDSFISGYRARDSVIETGPVALGANAFVGEATVIDIGTSLGDRAQLGHSSSLQTGQSVPDGQHWHGSPAQPTTVDYQTVSPRRCGAAQRVRYCVVQLLGVLLIGLPLLIGIDWLLDEFPGTTSTSFANWMVYVSELEIAAVLFFGPVCVGLVLVMTVPRLMRLVFEPGRSYPLYGFRYSVHRLIVRVTNLKFFMYLSGDSAYVVHYLRGLGYDLAQIVQTGSNFGVEVKHETPFLSSIGSGTMVSDGLSMINADFSNSSFQVSRAAIGERNFLGNNIAYPAGGRTGNNCLLATKVMVPLDGEIREDVGLLGSPPFEIPRSVQRDSDFAHIATGEELGRRLVAKQRHNTVTIGLFLLVRWIYVLGDVLIFQVANTLQGRLGASAFAAATILSLLFSVVYFVLIERAATGFRRLRPQFCSIYDPYFWWHERFWKLSATTVLALFNGTPFKSVIWRMLGVRIGRMVFDDGCAIPEKTLVTIGDRTMLNVGSCIQCHSLEDGAFKSGRITVGYDCTLGPGAFVHYGTQLGDGSVLDADSFLMKGEEVQAHARWQGNPASEVERARHLDTRPPDGR